MPVTQIATGRAFSYVDNIGQIGTSATSLRHPVGVARGANDVLYVANWGTESQGGARITKCVMSTQEWLADIGRPGSGDGEFLWPGGLVSDQEENLYLTDQADSKVVIFDKEGGFIGKWGEEGSEPGQMMRPSGIAFDCEGNLLVSDTRNHRIQKFTKDGQFLDAFGSRGSGAGEFDLPWGLGVDGDGNIYVADWGNSRVQKLTASGQHMQSFGEAGDQVELNHPQRRFRGQGRGRVCGGLGQQPGGHLSARRDVPGEAGRGRDESFSVGGGQGSGEPGPGEGASPGGPGAGMAAVASAGYIGGRGVQHHNSRGTAHAGADIPEGPELL